MIQFKKLGEEHLEQVLKWRTQEDVTQYMNTDVEKDMNKQRKWFELVSTSKTDKYWVISIQDKLVGLIYLNDINYVNQRASWGFYIGEEDYRMYGAIIPLYFYDYVFTKLELHKITAEIISENKNVIKLNKIHGCREVGVYYDHIYKNGTFHDLVIMEMLKSDWDKNEKHQKYKGEFEE